MNIYQVVESGGVIVFSDEDTGVIIAATGSYLNWYNGDGTNWRCSDSRARDTDLYSTTAADLIDEAKRWFNQVMNNEREDDNEDDEDDQDSDDDDDSGSDDAGE